MLKKISLFLGIVVFLTLVVFLYITYFKNETSVLVGLVFDREINLKKSDDHINVLILGIGGGNHEGPDLSDTIIVAHVDPEKNIVTLISIPRDLWIVELSAKINSAYFTGIKKGAGIHFATLQVEKVIGETIDYTVIGDFSGFEKGIDLLEGIDVEVKNTFDDYEYPITGAEQDPCGHTEEELLILATASSQLEAFPCRYQHVHFDKGITHMDGATALTYVRSRHAQGQEGSDFARSNRQHQVIVAIKNKMLSLGTLASPVKVFGMYNLLKEHIRTNIPTEEFDDVIKLANKMKDAKIVNYVIDSGDEKEKSPGLLVNPPLYEYQGQWVLIPRIGNGNFSEIHSYVDCILQGNSCEVKENGIEVFEKK